MAAYLVTDNPRATEALGEAVGHALTGGAVVLLEGELGGGKTTFVRGLVRGAGVTAEARSPTFTLIRGYGRVIHADLYRLAPGDAVVQELEEYLDGDFIVAVEWGAAFAARVPPDVPTLRLKFDILDAERRGITAFIGSAFPTATRAVLEGILCG